MAEPLRKVAGGYDPAIYRQPAVRQTRRSGGVDLAPKRLVRRQIRSNAVYRRTVVWVASGLLSFLFLMGFSNAYLQAGISRVYYDINTAQNEKERILLENDKIRGQIAELRSLERIEEIASRELGMVKNDRIEYMVLSNAIVEKGKLKPEEALAQEEEQAYARPLEEALQFLSGMFTWTRRAR